MKVSDEVKEVSDEIKLWMRDFKVSPRLHNAEVPLLVHYIRDLQPGSIVVEIGTGWAGTAVLFTKVCKRDTLIYTIDDGSNFERFGPKDLAYEEFINERLVFYGLPARQEQKRGVRLIWIRADSTRINWDKPIDLLFIDGTHSYEGVRGDIENMVPHVKDGCIIVFHDYHMEGVKRAVDEFLRESGLEIENRAHSIVAVRKVLQE